MARRFRRWPGLATTLVAIMLAAAVLRAWFLAGHGSRDLAIVSSTAGSRIVLEAGPCEIVGAVDSSTLLVKQGPHRFHVRLLAVEIPAGMDQLLARAELSRIAPAGPARIELDKRRATGDGSWLAYVYVGETLVNAELIAAGHAVYDVYPGDSFTIGRLLKDAQNEARLCHRGIWRSDD